MALINTKDFSILSGNDDILNINEYFECDDLIAPAISMLNRKGYTTKCCCSGHPFDYITGYLCKHDNEFNDEYVIYKCSSDTPEIQDAYATGIDGDPSQYPFYVVTKFSENVFYVYFENDYDFPTLPDEFEVDHPIIDEERYCCIRYRFVEETIDHCTETFDDITRIYSINYKFYKWVESL